MSSSENRRATRGAAALLTIAALGIPVLPLVVHAQLPPPPAETPRAEGPADGSDAGPRGRSQQRTLLQDPLHALPGKQATLLRIEYPPGWIGQRHYHTGDVILYVLSGRFTIDVDGGKRTTIGPGETYHEAVHTVMQARNASASEATTLLLFQVGDRGERLTVTVD